MSIIQWFIRNLSDINIIKKQQKQGSASYRDHGGVTHNVASVNIHGGEKEFVCRGSSPVC